MRGSLALVAGAAMAAVFSAGASAQQAPGDATTIGMGMICDSHEQAARFIELRASGRKADAAMAIVNKEAHNKQACGLATIAFTKDATLSSKSIDNKLVQVVRVNILAGFTGTGWQRVSNFVQYAVVEADGIDV